MNPMVEFVKTHPKQIQRLSTSLTLMAATTHLSSTSTIVANRSASSHKLRGENDCDCDYDFGVWQKSSWNLKNDRGSHKNQEESPLPIPSLWGVIVNWGLSLRFFCAGPCQQWCPNYSPPHVGDHHSTPRVSPRRHSQKWNGGHGTPQVLCDRLVVNGWWVKMSGCLFVSPSWKRGYPLVN